MFGGMPGQEGRALLAVRQTAVGAAEAGICGIFAVVALVVVSVVLNVIAPKILGQAMDVIFSGVVGKQLPAGASKEQFDARAPPQGQDNFADMIARMELVPGTGSTSRSCPS